MGLYQVTHKNGERYSAAKAYLTPHLGRPNLKVITGAHATRILLEGQRAVGVEFLQDGQRHELRAAREVLLSAGALQSPQLLMLSGIGPRRSAAQAGIAPRHDLPGVGQNLQDHVDVVLVYDAPQLTDLFGLSFTGALQRAAGHYEWRWHRRGMLTTNFAEAGGFIRSQAGEAIPDLQLHFVIAKLVDHGRTTTIGHGYSCHVCLLRPKSRGSVRLVSTDPLAAPLIDPNFLGERDDVDRLIRGFKLMRSILSQPGARALWAAGNCPLRPCARTDPQIEQFIRNHADTIYHPAGSCRMGPRADGRGGRPAARARAAGAARGGRLHHARPGGRQHQCAR